MRSTAKAAPTRAPGVPFDNPYAEDQQWWGGVEENLGTTVSSRVLMYASSFAAFGVAGRLAQVVHPLHALGIAMFVLALVVAARTETAAAPQTDDTRLLRVIGGIVQQGAELLAGSTLTVALGMVFPLLPAEVPAVLWAVAIPFETTLAGALLVVILRR
jgi:hypothetical protein